MMLNKDPNQRPTIHKLLQQPLLKNRITKYLGADLFKEEFAHTLLHNQNVFEEFRKIQADKKATEQAAAEAKKQAEKLAQMKLEEKPYQPPQSYIDQYKDPTVFNSEYQKYV